MIYRTCTQLLKKRPVLLCIFRRRKIHAVFVTQFLLAEAEERAKGWIDEERLTFQGLHCNSDGTRVENIMEKLSLRGTGLCCFSHRTMCIAPSKSYGNGIGCNGIGCKGRGFTKVYDRLGDEDSWANFFTQPHFRYGHSSCSSVL